MIPKIIHYCWFGANPLTESALTCISSWKKYFPDYEIKEWNETNYDVAKLPYIKEAYEAGKYAFVSDYVRIDVLYQYGGIYFDTDVEVIKSFDDIIAKGGFMGQEAKITLEQKLIGDRRDSHKSGTFINSGLGIAAAPGLELYKEILDSYSIRHFIKENGDYDLTTICVSTTELLKEHGYDETKETVQEIADITIYPPEFFCPLTNQNGKLRITESTRSIHWYSGTWMSETDLKMAAHRRSLVNKYGVRIGELLSLIQRLPYILNYKFKSEGVQKTMESFLRK